VSHTEAHPDFTSFNPGYETLRSLSAHVVKNFTK
jgi:hypothetical protein